MPFRLRKTSPLSRFLRFYRRNSRMLQLAALLGFSLALHTALKLRWYLYPFNLLALYLGTGGWRFARVIWLTLGRDLSGYILVRKVKGYFRSQVKQGKTVAELFHETCLKYPNQPALINAETGSMLTFSEMEDKANRVAHLFRKHGYKSQDCVALMMDGCPEYVCYWLGLSKIGVIAGLLNYSLRGDSLAHCITIVNAKAIIYGSVYREAIEEIKDKFDSDMEFYNGDGYDSTLMTHSLLDLLPQVPNTWIPKEKGQDSHSKLMYIYTSGTTGMPKAATIRHARSLYLGFSIGTVFGASPKDIGYIALPLYHSNGGFVGLGNCLFHGVTCVIRKKFSASRFVDDCLKYNVTMIFYIGEICRYLLGQPKRPEDNKLKIRVAIGNGLRPQIWKEFQERFNIKLVGEFYGATESNAGMVNAIGKPGAVGYTSMIAPSMFPLVLIKVDPMTGEIVRSPNGLAIKCKPGEPGELVGKIDNSDVLGRFDGYVNKKATEKKIAYDVLTKGDSVFRTGDILTFDELGFFYFMDRTGDTFRWKGENVSTTEVESTVSKIIQLKDVVAYGVEVPGAEGKAGMLTIADPEGDVDLDSMAERLKAALPAYARPLFVRISKGVNFTSTFKFKKNDLRKEGFDPNLVGGDRLYVANAKSGLYEELTSDAYNKIMTSQLRL